MGTEWTLDRTFDSPNGTVRWARSGQGDPLVLVHGWPFSSYIWRDLARALSTRHTVYVWDLPGYGASERYEGQDVSLAGHQQVFASLLDHWGLERPAVAAHDIGGAVALRTALLSGRRFERLALVDAVAAGPWGSPFFQLANRQAPAFAQVPAHLHEALVRAYIADGADRQLREETLKALARPWTGAHGQAAFYRQMAQAHQRHTAEYEDRLGELDLPVAVVWGERDRWLPLQRGRELAERLPRARLHVLEGSGHLVQEDAPAQLAAVLGDFLAR
ncbi:alpha/beta fold hydrolase [Nocardiopsis halophila]|uniref:alpha/beta fold hydrolase n=1 Tax=Nocardiopsis halophila TaxID=141692 RepID=UPI000344BE52|nr:alpha/beta fold hydrolase [Nocardiopsis halophila]